METDSVKSANVNFICISLLSLLSVGQLTAAEQVDDAFFESRIRPLLIQKCAECHGRTQSKNGLRVDSRDALIKGGDSGAAIVSGNAAASLLIRAIRRTDADLQMPPKASLAANEVADFVRWVDAGAPWPAFQPVKSKRLVTTAQVSPRSPDDPKLKPALQVWLKADGNPWQDGQSVHLWEDASGRGHDLVATKGARREGTGDPPKFISQSQIVGFPAVRFTVDSGLGGSAATAPDITGDAEFTMLLVARIQSDPTSQGLIAGFGEPAPPANPGKALCAIIGLQPGSPTRPVFVGGWGNDAMPATPSGPPIVDGPPMIMTLTKLRGPLDSTAQFHVNGTQVSELQGNTQIPNLARRDDLGFFMGHARSWLRGFSGDVAEVLLFKRSLDTNERQSLEAHLSTKYRLPLATNRLEEVVTEGDPAFDPPHWAFQPVKQVSPPATDDPLLKHPIDRFLSVQWTKQGLKPAPQADARTLVRRLHFDLLGLPPSPTEMDQAVTELTPWNDAAWSALVNRLLDSPRYGERWGRHWLDVVRYADTAGDNADYPVPEARLYRDYVIDAFNADMPYDQFVREQLAGDLIARDDPQDRYADLVTATGFLALSRRYATGPYELWHLTLEDTIDTVGQAFMGLTLKCARCHDHKFDPVSQQDYYALYGIFESTQFPWAGAEEFHSQKRPRQHFVPLVPPDQLQSLLAAPASADKQVEEAARRRGFPQTVPIAYGVKDGTPRPAVLQRSGDPGQPGPVVARGVPAFLSNGDPFSIPEGESGRRQLATWLTRPEHPLTARVMVNRIWQQHFGRGLVPTTSNFGVRGAPPSHPELLDWLSKSFVDGGWSIKAMHRLVLTSRAWRLDSSLDPDSAARDPGNEFVWRHDRRRLEAEAIRDSMLAASGRLDLNRPGEHPFPPIVNWTYTQHNQFKDFYPSLHRSVYLMTTRLQRHPFLALFDGPDTNTTVGARASSIVPAQALYLMNSAEVKTEAEAFANRVLSVSAANRIDTAYAIAYQRRPDAGESAQTEKFLADYAAKAGEANAWIALCRSLLTSHEFFYVE